MGRGEGRRGEGKGGEGMGGGGGSRTCSIGFILSGALVGREGRTGREG